VSARAWLAFAVVCTLWGTPYLLIKVAVEDGVPPIAVAWLRIVLGAAVLIALAHRAGVLSQVRGRLRWLVAFAVAEIVVPFPLIAIAEQHIDSSLAAILVAAAPLFVALLALRFDASERAGGARLAGLFMGLVGVAALVGIDVSGQPEELLGAGAVLLAAFGYAVAPMVLKRHLADVDARASMGASLALSALILAPLAALDLPTEMPSPVAAGSIVALGLLCTALAMAMFAMLIAEVGAGRALVITYVCPVVALLLGIAVLDERPGPGTAIGLVLILAGSWLWTRGPSAASVRRECGAAPGD
jgi:drug/metabolite transporter (DMT)-like permease